MSNRLSSSDRRKALYQLAKSQGRYFTTKQAAAFGYSNKRIYHVRAANWIRKHRGIYRLLSSPNPNART